VDGITGFAEQAVNAAEAATVTESSAVEESPEASANDAAGVTSEQETSEETQTQESAAEGDETSAESAEEAAKRTPSHIPYERFQEVNEAKKVFQQSHEALNEILADPAKFVEVYEKIHGRSPFDGAAASAQQQADPTQELLDKLIPPEYQSLTEDDFATEGEWRLYQMAKGVAEQSAGTISALLAQSQQATAKQQADAYESQLTQAKNDLKTFITGVETEFGVPLTPEEQQELIKEAASYGDRYSVTEGLERAKKIVFFDRALQHGREQAAKIRETKAAVTGARPAAAGGGGGSKPVGMSVAEAAAWAVEQALGH
jgi:hypothetical protein